MYSVEIMANGLIFVQCRASGLRCCFEYDRLGRMIWIGKRKSGDLQPAPAAVSAALSAAYPTFLIFGEQIARFRCPACNRVESTRFVGDLLPQLFCRCRPAAEFVKMEMLAPAAAGA